MQNQTCSSCHYFYQHYVLNASSFTRTGCGHCVYPRIKHRKPSAAACEHFQQKMVSDGSSEQDAFLQLLAKEFAKHLRSQLAGSEGTETSVP